MTNLSEATLLAACLQPYEGTFAGGQQANNKLDCEILETHPTLREAVVKSMMSAVMRHKPDFVVGVPRGATWLAEAVAEEQDIPVVRLDYRQGDPEKHMFYKTVNDAHRSVTYERGVLVEDVFNRFTNTRRALAVAGLAVRIVAAEAIVDRGYPDERQALPIPASARIVRPIPAVITPDSPLFRYIQGSV